MTPEELDAIEAHWKSWGTLSPSDHWRSDLLALVGELRAERERSLALEGAFCKMETAFTARNVELRAERERSQTLHDALQRMLDADETFRDNGPAIEEWQYVVVLDEARDALAAVSVPEDQEATE